MIHEVLLTYTNLMFQLSHFEQEAPVSKRPAPSLPFIPEISSSEMILAWMSDVYEIFNLITLFIN